MQDAAFPYVILPFSGRANREGFSCGIPELDTYLRKQARQDAKRHVAAPFLLTAPPSDEVLGFYTLSSSTVDLLELPPEMAKKLPRYPDMPVILMGRLALDGRFKGQGLGELLLMDALRRCARSEIAAMALVVDAKDEEAKRFYQHFDFLPLQSKPMRLFLSMATIKKIFPDSGAAAE